MMHKLLTETIIPSYHSAAHHQGMMTYKKGKQGPVLNSIIEVPARKKDGQETIIELTIIPIEIDGNTFFCSFIRDVSQRKKAEQEIKDLNLHLEDKVMQRTFQLETAIKELDSFSYSVSHDLRSPLRAIDGWSLALIEDFTELLNEEALNYVNRIRNESQRMGALIDDILNLSSIGRTELNKSQVSIFNLTHDIFDRLINESPRKRILQFKVQENLSLFVDEKMFSILFNNLIENSIKFTSKVDVPQIDIGSEMKDDRLVIFIRDNGAGFNMENASKLFGAFQRMHRASEFPGTGIGLATVQRIVRLHGGEIWAESEINKGTTFYIYIPQSPEK
jgi:light-regulated signal transduction histidine kinase (bacteriophytochrome)